MYQCGLCYDGVHGFRQIKKAIDLTIFLWQEFTCKSQSGEKQ